MRPRSLPSALLGLMLALWAAPAHAAITLPPNLNGENFGASSNANPDLHQILVTTIHCAAGTASFTAAGPAAGPYPGTFTETGTFTFATEPSTVADPPPLRDVLSVDATFTLESGDTTIMGTKHAVRGEGLNPQAAVRCNEFNGD